jgi:hypothetical protein
LMMPQRDWKDHMKLLRLRTRLMETTQLAGVDESVSLSGVFQQLVIETVSELSPECFKPSANFGQAPGGGPLAAGEDTAKRGVA